MIRLNPREFEELVIEAVSSLPDQFKNKLDNVDIIVENCPSHDVLKKTGVNKRNTLLGLYQGIPLSKRTHNYGMVLPDKISIFKNNIENICGTKKDIVLKITHVVRHELAHHFGITDKRLKDTGLY